MKILIVSFFFPPFNTIGAVRVGKTAKWLNDRSHDVRVITAKDQPLQSTLTLEIQPENVTYTSWFNINQPAEIVLGGREKVKARGFDSGGNSQSLLKKLGVLYKSLWNFPDGQIGWFPFAIKASSELLEHWQPDIIYASAQPFTSLLVAYFLSQKYSIPWVAELRDLWIDNPYYPYPSWRKKLEQPIENLVLSSTAGLVTVSQPLADVLKRKYNKPTAIILNGFEPGDYPPKLDMPIRNDLIKIVYTGMIYEGKQDPSCLFEALNALGSLSSNARVVFYGRYLGLVSKLARQHSVEHLVDRHEMIPYKEALKVQQEADILLLLLGNAPEERGVFTGKLFEYIGAGRPILAIGLSESVAADLIRERSLGVVLNDPSQIADQLGFWINQKQQMGSIPSPTFNSNDLTRYEQTKKLESFLLKLVNN